MMLSLALAGLSPALAVPSVDTPVRSGATAPNDAAVIIGVEDYAFLPDVLHANRDALALYNWAVYTRGIPLERVQLLSGGNREQILDAVRRARASATGQVWVTFAGHGATSPDTGDLLLVGDDAKPDPVVFVARSIPVAELAEAAGPRATFLLDACAAGRTRGGDELLPGTRFAVPAGVVAAPSARVWTAAGPTQVAEPYGPSQHGLFTYFAAGALRGWADGELDGKPDGAVTLREARAFVNRAIATVRPGGQVPTLSGDSDIVVASGPELEPPPDLALMPKIGQAAMPVQLTPPVSVPFLPAPTSNQRRLTFSPPVAWTPGGLIEDSQGRTVEMSAVMASTSGFAEADRAARRYQAAKTAQATGGTAALTGIIVVGAVGMLALNSDSPVEPLGYLPYSGIGVLGVGLWTWGAMTAPRARNQYLQVANEVLEGR